MDTRFVNIGQALDIKAVRQYLGKGVTGLTVSLTIQRASDSQYWTGAGWSTITVLTMVEKSAVTHPGDYTYVGPVAVVNETYVCHAYVASGTYAFDGYETLISAISTDSLSSDISALPTDALSETDPRLPVAGVIAVAGDAMTLTAAYDSAKTAASQTSVNAIPTTPLLAADVRLDHLDADISSRLAPGGTLDTVTNVVNAPTAGDFTATMKTSLNAATPTVDKTGYALTAAYDAAKTAATQTSVNAIPTNPLLTTDTRLDHLDADISSRAEGAVMIADMLVLMGLLAGKHTIDQTGTVVEKYDANNRKLVTLTRTGTLAKTWAATWHI